MPRLTLKRPPGADATAATGVLVSTGAGLDSAGAGLASFAGAFAGAVEDTGAGALLPSSGASNVDGAFVSTVTSLSEDLAGASVPPGAAAGADGAGSTASVRVSNLRSGNGGMSRFWIALSGLGGALPRNIGTKMIASATSTAAPSRRCLKAGSMGDLIGNGGHYTCAGSASALNACAMHRLH